MITKITIEGFKSLRKVELDLGHLNLFVGTNASGKSNFLDALRILQGIGYGFTFAEIFDGKPKSAGSEVWDNIRGGSATALFWGADGNGCDGAAGVVKIAVSIRPENGGKLINYTIGIDPIRGHVRSEKLEAGAEGPIYEGYPDENPAEAPVFSVRYFAGKRGQPPRLSFEKSRPVLHQIHKDPGFQKKHSEAIAACVRAISNTQRIDPSPPTLREYSRAQQVKRMGEKGENFAALVKNIVGDQRTRTAYLDWLRQLTPVELDDVAVLSGALGEPLFALKEGNRDYPAPVLSDGTLRFAAIAAAFFQEDMPDILTIEEIENGVHPSRLRLLVELLRSQAGRSLQVMATTHSPIVLAWLKENDYRTTFFCKRDENTGASVIMPLSQVPGFMEIVRKQPIGELFAEGWLEGAL